MLKVASARPESASERDPTSSSQKPAWGLAVASKKAPFVVGEQPPRVPTFPASGRSMIKKRRSARRPAMPTAIAAGFEAQTMATSRLRMAKIATTP